MAPKAKMPDAHNLGAELEATAHAAGRYWRALKENGLPPGFRVAMFDNWQRSLWSVEDAMAVGDEADPEFAPA